MNMQPSHRLVLLSEENSWVRKHTSALVDESWSRILNTVRIFRRKDLFL